MNIERCVVAHFFSVGFKVVSDFEFCFDSLPISDPLLMFDLVFQVCLEVILSISFSFQVVFKTTEKSGRLQTCVRKTWKRLRVRVWISSLRPTGTFISRKVKRGVEGFHNLGVVHYKR